MWQPWSKIKKQYLLSQKLCVWNYLIKKCIQTTTKKIICILTDNCCHPDTLIPEKLVQTDFQKSTKPQCLKSKDRCMFFIEVHNLSLAWSRMYAKKVSTDDKETKKNSSIWYINKVAPVLTQLLVKSTYLQSPHLTFL